MKQTTTLPNAPQKRAFTLIEVLVTVTVICILAIITVMTYSSLQGQAHDKDRKSKAQIIANRLEKYYRRNGEYPSVPAIVGQPGSVVQQKLRLTDPSVLVLPSAPKGTTNSLTQDDPSKSQLAYNGESVKANEEDQCLNDLSGGCDQFTLQWETEAGETREIHSLHQGRPTITTQTVPESPAAPTLSAGLSGGNVVATINPVSCESGASPEYKLVSTTNKDGSDPTLPEWATVGWTTSRSKSLAATQGTHYYFKAIAHCVNQAGGSEDSDDSDIVEYYYATAGTPSLSVSISGTTVYVSVSPATCPTGATAKYQIWEKKDTPTATGTMAVISTRNFTTTNTYTGTAGATTAPTKNTYRAYTRCDSGGSPGLKSSASADAYVVSAPAAPSLSKNVSGSSGTANSVTWSWSKPACPVGTSVVFDRIWTGDYTNRGSGGTTTATSVGLTTSSQGYQYGMHVRASCGNPISGKVLQSAYSTNVTYVRDVTSEIWVYKGSIRIRRPEPSAHPTAVYGQSHINTSRNVAYDSSYNTSTPYKDYPANGNCASGLTRKVQWQWAANHVGTNTGWRYGGTSGGYSPEYTWANGTSKTFPSGGSTSDYTGPEDDLDAGDKYEAAFRSWCENTSTGRHGPTNRVDAFGNITVLEGNGKFHTWCDNVTQVPWCLAWHTSRNPLSGHNGYANNGSTRGDCSQRSGLAPTGSLDNKCFTPYYNSNASPWGW